MRTHQLAFAIGVSLAVLLLATPYVYETAATDTHKSVRQYWVKCLGGLFWIPSEPLYTTLREQTVVDGRAVWKTVYVAGPEPAWELIGVLSLLLAVIGWFAGAEWRRRRTGRSAP